MPVQTHGLDPVDVLLWRCLPHFRTRPQQVGNHNHTANHMQPMQAGEREIDTHVIIRPWEKTLREFLVVFDRFDDHETTREQQGAEKVNPELCEVLQAQ